jgi:hypothetical protein
VFSVILHSLFFVNYVILRSEGDVWLMRACLTCGKYIGLPSPPKHNVITFLHLASSLHGFLIKARGMAMVGAHSSIRSSAYVYPCAHAFSIDLVALNRRDVRLRAMPARSTRGLTSGA